MEDLSKYPHNAVVSKKQISKNYSVELRVFRFYTVMFNGRAVANLSSLSDVMEYLSKDIELAIQNQLFPPNIKDPSNYRLLMHYMNVAVRPTEEIRPFLVLNNPPKPKENTDEVVQQSKATRQAPNPIQASST